MADVKVRDQAREAARALALERLPVFLRTSPLEVLVGVAVAALGVLTGGLTGSALVGLGVLLVAWTTATGVAAARTAATLEAAHADRLDAFGRRLLAVDAELDRAEQAVQPEVRAALFEQARRSLGSALGDLGIHRGQHTAPAAGGSDAEPGRYAEPRPPGPNGAATVPGAADGA